jgi:hypothetical protein
MSLVLCVVRSGWSLIQTSPTDCGVSEYDPESSTMRLWPSRRLLRHAKNKFTWKTICTSVISTLGLSSLELKSMALFLLLFWPVDIQNGHLNVCIFRKRWLGIFSPSTGWHYAQDSTVMYVRNTDIHPWLECDWSLAFQYVSGRTQYASGNTRPLWLAFGVGVLPSFLVWPLLPIHHRCRGLFLRLITFSYTYTLGRTPLDEGSAPCRDLCLHNT